MEPIRIELDYKDNGIDVMDKVNEAIAHFGLKFEWEDKVRDDGKEVYFLVKQETK
jgi:hypothetical protein